MVNRVEVLDEALRRVHRLSEPGQFMGASDRKRALLAIREITEETLSSWQVTLERIKPE